MTLLELTAHDDVDDGPSRAGAPKRAVRKVFYLLDSLNIGGTETQAVELARRMAEAGYEVTLGCLRAEGPLREALVSTSVRVMEFYPSGGIDSPGGLYQFLRLSWFLRRQQFDIVHTHDLWSNLMGIPAAWLAGVPAKISSRRDLAHLDWYKGKRRKWLRRVLNLSDAILANATAIRDSLIANENFAPSKVHVIPNGIDVSRFAALSNRRAVLFPGHDNSQLIVLVGNMHSEVKGHSCVIASAPAVLRQFPGARFVFVGDGEKRADFERQASELGLQDRFLFLGRRNDVPEILGSCDVGILPSQAEGMSNALLEYMASGLPVIASRVGGNEELVQENIIGFLIPPDQPAALAEAVLKLLRDPEKARTMGRAGQTYAAQKFSFEKLVLDIDQLYSQLLQKRRHSPTTDH